MGENLNSSRSGNKFASNLVYKCLLMMEDYICFVKHNWLFVTQTKLLVCTCISLICWNKTVLDSCMCEQDDSNRAIPIWYQDRNLVIMLYIHLLHSYIHSLTQDQLAHRFFFVRFRFINKISSHMLQRSLQHYHIYTPLQAHTSSITQYNIVIMMIIISNIPALTYNICNKKQHQYRTFGHNCIPEI